MMRFLKTSMLGCGRLSMMPLSLVSVITAPLLVMTALVFAWLELRPQRAPLSTPCRAVIDKVVPDVLADLQLARSGIRSVKFVPLQFDPTGEVTDALRAAIERTNMVVLANRSFAERFRRLTNGDQLGSDSFTAALDSAKSEGAMAVLFGSIDRLELTDTGARLELNLQFARVADGAILLNKHYVKDLQPAVPAINTATGSAANWPPIVRRLLILGVTILLLPILSIGFLARLVARRSNGANAIGLLVMGIIAALLAHLLVAPDLDTVLGWTVTGTSFVITLLYTALIASNIADRRDRNLYREFNTADGI